MVGSFENKSAAAKSRSSSAAGAGARTPLKGAAPGAGGARTGGEIRSVSRKQLQQHVATKLAADEEPSEHPAHKRFTNLLDEIVDTYEQDLGAAARRRNGKQNDDDSNSNSNSNSNKNNEEDEQVPAEYLLNKQVCAEMVQEAFKLSSLSIMHTVRKENLAKLQTLLYFNVKVAYQQKKSPIR